MRGKSTRVRVELIALAIAWRDEDASLHGLDDTECLELFGLAVDGNVQRCSQHALSGRSHLRLT